MLLDSRVPSSRRPAVRGARPIDATPPPPSRPRSRPHPHAQTVTFVRSALGQRKVSAALDLRRKCSWSLRERNEFHIEDEHGVWWNGSATCTTRTIG